MIQFLYLTFLLNYIIMESVVNVLIFFVIYILHLKYVLNLLQCYQMNLLLKEVFRKGCPLSPVLFNLFINKILNNCEKYGVSIGKKKKCCGELFTDDVVLIAPSAKNLEKLLKKRYINGLI